MERGWGVRIVCVKWEKGPCAGNLVSDDPQCEVDKLIFDVQCEKEGLPMPRLGNLPLYL